MDKLNLTIEQKQAAAILEDYLNEIQISLEWILQLSNEISIKFFNTPNVQEFLSNSSITESERLFKAAKILWEYDVYGIYTNILSHLILEVKETVDNIVDSVYH